MGVPSYFSYIIKQHRNMVKKRSMLSKRMDNLYMDCNSLIYDAVKNSPTYDKTKKTDYEKELINMVCKKIDYFSD